MPTSLTATKIKDTYGQLLHVDGGVTSTLKTVYDGDGTATALSISTTGIAGNLTGNVTGNVSGNAGTVTNGVYTTGDQTIGGTKTFSSNPIMSAGTANGVAYLNGSKVLTTGSALQFDGTNLGIGIFPTTSLDVAGPIRSRVIGGIGQLYLNNGTTQLSIDNNGGQMVFTTAGAAEQMRLTSTGLGIGTSSPAGKVHAVNTYTNSSDATIIAAGNIPGINIRANSGARMSVLTNYVTADSTSFLTSTGSANPSAEVLRFDHSNGNVLVPTGNLGLGVTPSAWSLLKGLQVVNANFAGYSNRAYVSANAYFNGGGWVYQATDYANAYMQQSGQHQWYTAPSGTAGNAISFTQAMTLDASGNLGIGTSSPTSFGSGAVMMTVSGTSGYGGYLANTTNVQGQLWSSEGGSVVYCGSRSNHPLVITTNNTERMRIDSSGNLLVGTTSIFSGDAVGTAGTIVMGSGSQIKPDAIVHNNNNYYIVDQNGTGVYIVNGATSWTATSDERLKTDIVPISDAANKVSTLRAVTGRYKTDKTGTSRSFLIAQDVQKVLPEAVNVQDDEQGTLGLQYTDVIPLLVAAIKELKTELDATKAEVAALKAK